MGYQSMLPAEEVVFLMKRLNELFGQVLAENDKLKEKNEKLYEELQAWKEGAKKKEAFHQHIVENEKKLTRLNTASKVLELTRERLEEYRLNEEWEEDGKWCMDSSIFVAEVVHPQGILDKIYEEVTGEKYEYE